MTHLQIQKYNGEGYSSLVQTPGWRVAMLNYSLRFDRQSKCELERHLFSDESFVLLAGEAQLLTAGNQPIPDPIVCTGMDCRTIYNIPQGMWHHLWVSKNASLLVVENNDVSSANTEKYICGDTET